MPGVRSLRQLTQTKLYRPDQYDQTIEVTNREAFEMCLRLNREESIIAGPSSGMALVGALRTVRDEPGTIAIVMFADNAFKYPSSFRRHFPDICPVEKKGQSTGPSPNDQFVAMLVEKLKKNPYDSILVDDLSRELQESEKPLVVDVRHPEMFAKLHITGSVNIPMGALARRDSELPTERDTTIVMVCNVGKTSMSSTLLLKAMGYRNVRSMTGGVTEWVGKGHPTQSTAVGAC